MEILFLSRWFPYPADNGSKIRIAQLLAGLASAHRITLISFTDDPHLSPNFQHISGLDRISEVYVLPWREFHPGSLRALLGLLHPMPRSLLDTRSADMASLIRTTVAHHKFDLVIASQLAMAAYRECFRDVPAVFEEIELGVYHDAASQARGLKRLRLTLTWFKIKQYISRLIRSYPLCTVASERERDLLARNFPGYAGMVEVVPNCIDMDQYHFNDAKAKPDQIVFSGSFKYRANYDAMLWFVGEVFPRILERKPDVRLIITGDHDNLPLPGVTNVTLAGHVTDIKSLISASSVSVAPLRVGGGTRLKILEAMALGTPVVATSKGAEGLSARHGEHLVIADTPASFADGVLGILENADRRRQLSSNARWFVEEHFSWNSKMPRYLQLIESAVRNRYNFKHVLI